MLLTDLEKRIDERISTGSDADILIKAVRQLGKFYKDALDREAQLTLIDNVDPDVLELISQESRRK